MDTLYRALVRTAVPGTQNAVIGRLVFERTPAPAHVDVQMRRQLTKLTAYGPEGRLEMSLLPAAKPQETALETTELPFEPTCTFRFSPQGVLAFVERLGDRNPLHRTAQPLVPGYQILCACLADLHVKRASIRFLQPTYANEDVRCRTAPGRIRGYTARGPVFDLTYLEEEAE